MLHTHPLIQPLGVLMEIEYKWSYPSWSLDIIIETEANIEIDDLLSQIDCLHQTDTSYAWIWSESPHDVTLHAERLKFASQRLFSKAVNQLRKMHSVKAIHVKKLTNVFYEENFCKYT